MMMRPTPAMVNINDAGPPIPPTRVIKAVECFSRAWPSTDSTPAPICRA
jgi:hypothetical protein